MEGKRTRDMELGKKNVLVCGTRFGQFYIEALRQMPDSVSIVGILAGTSERTKKCAEYYRLPVFSDVSELPDGIDLACVVIKSEVLGGKGSDVAKALMTRKINVLMEQPLHYNELADCAKCAQKSGVTFSIGNLYANLPATQNFIDNVSILGAKQSILFVNVDFATQVSYPLVDLLNRILPTLRPWETKGLIGETAPFQSAVAHIGGIQVNFRAHNAMDKLDADGYLHLLYRVSVGFPAGRLVLEDANGPVVWRPRMHFTDNPLIPASLVNETKGSQAERSQAFLSDVGVDIFRRIFGEHWPRAIARDVKQSLNAADESGSARKQTLQNLLLCSQRWHDLTKALGYPIIVENSPYGFIESKILKKDITVKSTHGITEALWALNAACYTTMLYVLCKYLPEPNAPLNRQELIALIKAKTGFKPVIHRWLSELIKAGYLLESSGGVQLLAPIVTLQEMEDAWADTRTIWNPSVGGDAVLDYFYNNAVNIEGILSGEINAAHLLFPEGDSCVADALYSETAISRYASSAIAEIIAKKAISKPYSILEIGGGTASTTKVAAALIQRRGLDVSYHFTDISDFFINRAREYFKDYSWMTFSKLDADNTDTNFSEPVDAIIAVGILNNVKHINKTLAWLNRQLRLGGHLIMVEAVGEAMPMLISQAFMMSEAEDSRGTDNVTFLTLGEWIDCATSSGFALERLTPPPNDPLNAYNQKLFVLKKIGV
jgi:thiazolinyl imide reductase